MTQHHAQNIGFHFLQTVRGHGDRTAIVSPRGTVNYTALEKLVRLYALHLQQRGVDRNACVAIHTTFLYNTLATTLAVALLGAKWCHATQTAFQEKALNINHLLLDADETHIEASDPARLLRIDKQWLQPPPGTQLSRAMDFPGCADPRDPLFFTHSSGTTGTPKFMFWDYGHVMQWQETVPDVQYDKTPVIANMFPMLSILGWFYSLSAILRGGTVVLHNRYDYLVQHGVNHIIASPSQFAQVLQNQPHPAIPLPAIAHVTGGPVTDALRDKMSRFFDTILSIYGSTEAGPVCISELTTASGPERSLGRPIEGVEIDILDPAGQPVPPGREGVVRIKTPMLVNGYIADDQATALAFKEGWFYPGDIGRINPAGEFVITGRNADILNLGGVKANVADIEEAIQACEGVADGICFLEPSPSGVETLAAVVRLKTDTTPDAVAREIRVRCKALPHPECYIPGRIYFIDTIPRNENGKPLRRDCPSLVKNQKSW